jgi:phosphate/sulfate permease/phage pi2 protein 07
MELFYLALIVFLFILAIFDLVVGVSNDAVNFLNSAIGSKAAPFKVVLSIAAIGILCGALFSNGMMEIARHGIFRPEQFYFTELMCIFIAVMITDVLLLDTFNSLGLPTSTTVSLVFELLGGSFALALLKIFNDSTGDLSFADLLNTEKALSVIFGIFLSVAIAFFFGMLVQYIARTIFTFNYKKNLKWTIGLFGGIAATSIVYFMLIKGVKDTSFMTEEFKAWIALHSGMIVLACMVFCTILMQILHWCRVNVFKVIVLMGTFALALAFAGNDLVNFIGVPLAGYASFLDYTANGTSVGGDHFLMNSLNGPAQTPLIFMVIAGIIMAFALFKSKKARNVTKTELDLSRQNEGDEMFGSSALARSLVRNTTNFSGNVSSVMPKRLKTWIGSRFNKEEVILEKDASFDLVRASVNLMLAGLLIALGTSLKLPLSTTYVTFMVAMGSSLSDRAWSRESSVFRITGVVSVIGGWFITAGVALIACFIVTLLLYYGGMIATVLMIALSVFILIRSNRLFHKKQANEKTDVVFKTMMTSRDTAEVWTLLKQHSSETLSGIVDFTQNIYTKTVEAFIAEDIRTFRKILADLNTQKDLLKKTRRRELLALRRIETTVAIEKNTWFHLANNNAEQIIYCLKRMAEPCKEHIDNNFNPLPEQYAKEFLSISNAFEIHTQHIKASIETSNYSDYHQLFFTCKNFSEEFSRLRHAQIECIRQGNNENLNVSLVYLNLLQESQELASLLRHLLRASRKFQKD